jgi:hypothetical protein
MLESILRSLRGIPVAGSVAEFLYARILIRDRVRSLRTAPLSDVVVSYEGEELEKELEKLADSEWTLKLEKWLMEEEIPTYMVESMKNGAIEKMKQAMKLKAGEQKGG